MSRPTKDRVICPGYIPVCFRTGADEPLLNIPADELEALRLCDLEELPQGEAADFPPDVVVLPMLAWNGLYRLGYGGGYYDRYLKGCTALKVGVAYDFQLTDEFKEDEWDEPLDMLITERGVYYFGNPT